MKKTLLLAAIPVFGLLFSCSAEEEVIETKTSRFNSEDIAKGLAKGMEGIEIDFSRLFEYSTIQEAQSETHKAIDGIIKDSREELAQRPDCNKAFVGFYIYAGKACLTSVCFVDSKEGAIKENFVYFNKGIRNYTNMLKEPLAQQLFIADYYANAEQLFAVDKDKEALDSFLKSKLQDTKTKGVAQFIVAVDASDTVVMGMP